MTHLCCAWLSQHEPTPSQRDSLAAYTLYPVDPPGRIWSPGDGWRCACLAVNGFPDVVVLILPESWVGLFIRRAHWFSPDTVIVRPVMAETDWAGIWLRLRWDCRRKLVRKTEWQPEGARP